MTFFRYVAVQIVAYGLDMGGFLVVLGLFGVGPIVANVFGKIAAGIFAFFAHRHFTFGHKSAERQGRQALMYFLLLALNIPLSSAALGLILLVITAPVPAKILADVISVFMSYWLSRKYIFPGGSSQSAGAAVQGDDKT